MKSKTGFEKQIITNSSEETQKAGEKFAKDFLALQGLAFPRLQGEALQNFREKVFVLALYGELGSGKTTFVQGLAKGLGINKRILSPTFTLIREHQIKVKSQTFVPSSGRGKSKVKNEIQKSKLFHIDLYRIEDENGIKGLGIEEIINDPDNIVVIEWAEKMSNFLPKERIDIYFEYLDEEKRKIKIICSDHNNF